MPLDGGSVVPPPRLSRLQEARLAFQPPLPRVLRAEAVVLTPGIVLAPPSDAARIAELFPCTFGKPTLHVEAAARGASDAPARPLRVGAVLSGGQAPGGHNVLSGIYDAVKRVHADSVVYGFLDGPRGVFRGDYVVIDDALISRYRNMGGACARSGHGAAVSAAGRAAA